MVPTLRSCATLGSPDLTHISHIFPSARPFLCLDDGGVARPHQGYLWIYQDYPIWCWLNIQIRVITYRPRELDHQGSEHHSCTSHGDSLSGSVLLVLNTFIGLEIIGSTEAICLVYPASCVSQVTLGSQNCRGFNNETRFCLSKILCYRTYALMRIYIVSRYIVIQ